MAGGDRRPEGAIRLRSHKFEMIRTKHRVLPWPVCTHCGLVLLRNEATRKAAKKGCWEFADEQH